MYRFNVGDKVKIRAAKTSSVGVKQHDGEIVTIKARCKFTWAYELEELDGLWQDRCFVKMTCIEKTTALQEKFPYFPWCDYLRQYGDSGIDEAYAALI